MGNKEVVLLDLKYRVGVSMMSAYPYSAVAPIAVSRWAKKADCEFLQVLPHRGIDGYEEFALPALYIEDAWNPVWSLRQALKGEDGDKGMSSNWRDWFGFPNPDKCERVYNRLMENNSLRPIAHTFNEAARGRLVELCTELEMTPEEILQEGYNLVLDTEHLVRGFRETDERFGQPSKLYNNAQAYTTTIIKLAPLIQVVHVKNIWDRREQNMLRVLLRANHSPEIDFVAEYAPKFGSPGSVKQYMVEFCYLLRNHISGCHFAAHHRSEL